MKRLKYSGSKLLAYGPDLIDEVKHLVKMVVMINCLTYPYCQPINLERIRQLIKKIQDK